MPLDTPAIELVCEPITTSAALWALYDEWNELWRRCPSATPFQLPDWLLAWWRHFGTGGLWSLALREPAGSLVGVAPLYLHPAEGVRTVRLIGAGVSDYLDVLALPGWGERITEIIWCELRRYPERWDQAEFQQLNADSPLLRWFRTCPAANVVPGEPCVVLPLPATADATPPLGSARFWENLRQDERRLRRKFGNVTIESATDDTAAALFEQLVALHRARWRARGTDGVIVGVAEDFQRDAMREIWKTGVGRLCALRVGERIAAAYYGFLCNRRAYYYLCGFDPEFRSFSVGNQLVAHGIRGARREGAQAFDFLRGEEPYKFRWGAEAWATWSVRLECAATIADPAAPSAPARVVTADWCGEGSAPASDWGGRRNEDHPRSEPLVRATAVSGSPSQPRRTLL